MHKHQRGELDVPTAVVLILIVIIIVAALFFGLPLWNVWRAGLSGQSELRKAEWNRQIAIREAEAKNAAAVELAKAEVERARGVAQANIIIGESLKNNEAYLRYLWVDSLDKTKNQVIYVPTEANIPILEAGKR